LEKILSLRWDSNPLASGPRPQSTVLSPTAMRPPSHLCSYFLYLFLLWSRIKLALRAIIATFETDVKSENLIEDFFLYEFFNVQVQKY
jgi:hypothetical protein